MRGSGTGEQLVIGIGNPLRGDDGVGWHLAAGRGLLCHQLTPELAEAVAAVDRVLFIDAWLAPEGTGAVLRPLRAAGEFEGSSHRIDPSQLLALVTLLFDRSVPAHELLVPAFDFSWSRDIPADGDPLPETVFSAEVRAGLPRARRLLRRWLQSSAREPCHA